MKNLVKGFLVITLFCFSANLFGQEFGLTAGLNMSNALIKDNDQTYSENFDSRLGFHVGATAEMPLTDMFSFQTGLLLSTKGYRSSEEFSGFGITVTAESNLDLLYLEIPLTGKATFDVGGAQLYGIFGPSVGIGLSGTLKSEAVSGGSTVTEEEPIVWGSNEDSDDFRRLDLGLLFGAGVEIQSIEVGINYNLGLANILPSNANGSRFSNRVLAISVGYKF
ncbi:Outer membrane protein beta-barrel domain-containing protein [Marivirga sericea]|uniref:Outer membrane protein beta-barrel domain-containing protein n=1 Tax=Marivirga sericea TaxID=1028 RepID=A0A1X7J021_9BACT|nr:porin family protein [Marivirga sericea]SMG20629.1 Outer membrane protein beta-barrel domain-containing protein [Marivirga sericea]